MRYLVTGGAGFIGSHYVRCLLDGSLGAEAAGVTVLDKLTYAGNLANLAAVSEDSRYSFVQGDICEGAVLDQVVPGHDVVVNFAAETHVDRSITGPQDFVVTNVAQNGGNPTGLRVEFTASNVTPVPEPETYAMLLAGLGLMGVISRRRAKRNAA